MIGRLTSPDAGLLALNNAHAAELSLLTAERFGDLVARSFLALQVPPAAALLLAFDQDAGYDSVNFRWFRERRQRFVYLDRIVVAAGARGRGHARGLYDRLFAVCRARGHWRVVCEVNSDPPNPASAALHASLGFRPVGEGRLPSGKTVQYLEMTLEDLS